MRAVVICLLATAAAGAQGDRVAYLIRFGLDGAAGVDWSGSISPQPVRLRGWQMDPAERSGAAEWKCATREQNYWDTPYERRMGPTSNKVKVTAKGVLVEFAARPAGEVRIATAQGSFAFRATASLWDAPQRFLDGRAEVRAVPPSSALPRKGEVPDYPSLLRAKDGTLWLAYTEWTPAGDQVLVRRGPAAAEAVAPAPGDFFRTAMAQDRHGRVWVVWAAQADGNFDLYGRAFDGRRWLPVERLTTAPGSDIYHAMTADAAGNLYLVYQSSRAGNFDIYLRIFDGAKWSGEVRVSTDPADDWEPAVAAARDGRVTVVWDTYAKGNYDVVCRTWSGGKPGPVVPIAATGAFEARASAQYDAQGRLWLAWEEGDWNWGKDYGNLIPEGGRGLLARRQTRVAVLSNGRRLEPRAPIADSLPEEFRQAFQHPRLALDAGGAPWVLFRYRVNLPRGAGDTSYRGTWRLGATKFQRGRWTPAIEIPDAHGRMDAPVSAAALEGRLDIAWISDGRPWPGGFPGEQQLYTGELPGKGDAPGATDLAAFRPPEGEFAPVHPHEAADVGRVRAWRSSLGERQYRIARGDIHRHTDLSWDGNRDGSLDDSYRYALDVAEFEFLGVCDHQAGQSIPYHWWMIQKAADLFAIAGRFAPLYSYERSLPWPNGHRNVVVREAGQSDPGDFARGGAWHGRGG